jgi:hypothetical protein
MTVVDKIVSRAASKVQNATGYGLEEIRNQTKVIPVLQARILFVRLLRDKDVPLRQIGVTINRDYASVRHLLEVYRNEYDTDSLFRKLANTVGLF